MTSSFDDFFGELLSSAGLRHSQALSVPQLRHIITKINEYLYTTYDGIGTTEALDMAFDYFSDFHRFWEENHQAILQPAVSTDRCKAIAKILNDLNAKNGKAIFHELYDTHSLSPEQVCRIRYFAANQDFRGTRDFEKLFQVFSDDPTIFDTAKINAAPEDFLKDLGITQLSQSDKRVKYAQTASQVLMDLGLEPYDLFDYFGKDLAAIRDFMLSKPGSGYGKKKTDMFLRDMVVLGVWENPKGFDKIDVASDVNTIKVALRTGILTTEIPLVSSFLDIFCYQYGLMDEMNATAWREVWNQWKQGWPRTCIESPSLIDYFVYRVIGKEFCKEALCIFECETGKHRFKWHSGRNKTCQVCKTNKAILVEKVLPCADKEGRLFIEKNEFVSGPSAILPGLQGCPFILVCLPNSTQFRQLNPPKSISILGQTGWESARAIKGQGGGGLMS